MKTSTMRWMITAAAMTVAAISASAQTYNAEIPMAFRAGETLLEPGNYQVKVKTDGSTIIFISSRETHQSLMVVPQAKSDPRAGVRRDGLPKLVFDCSGSHCSLNQVWDGSAEPAYNLPTHRVPAIEARQHETITVAMVRAR